VSVFIVQDKEFRSILVFLLHVRGNSLLPRIAQNDRDRGIEPKKHIPSLRDGGTTSVSSARFEKNIRREIRSDLNTED